MNTLERVGDMLEKVDTVPEPDRALASLLNWMLQDVGATHRLDLIQQVLIAVHRGGRTFERRELLRIADRVREDFAAAVAARREETLDVRIRPRGSDQ